MKLNNDIIDLVKNKNIKTDVVPIDFYLIEIEKKEDWPDARPFLKKTTPLFIKKYNHESTIIRTTHRPISKIIDPRYLIK